MRGPADQGSKAVCSLPLAARQNVGVDLQRDDRASVPEPLAHDVDRDAAGQQDRRMTVPEIMQPD